MKVKMLRDVDHHAAPAVVRAYVAGSTVIVAKALGDAWVAEGKAELVDGDAPEPQGGEG